MTTGKLAFYSDDLFSIEKRVCKPTNHTLWCSQLLCWLSQHCCLTDTLPRLNGLQFHILRFIFFIFCIPRIFINFYKIFLLTTESRALSFLFSKVYTTHQGVGERLQTKKKIFTH